MNKKGFISTALVYSFFLVFLMLLLFIVYGFTNNRVLLNKVKSSVKSELSRVSDTNAAARFKLYESDICNLKEIDGEVNEKYYTITSTIARLYNESKNDGSNNLYYHDNYGDYINADKEIGDYSYRFSGADTDVNNYVCFGYKDEDNCYNTGDDFNNINYLYRIIGIFRKSADNPQEYIVKLISADFANTTMLGTGGDYESTNNVPGDEYKGNRESIDKYYWNKANETATNTATGNKNVWSYSYLNTNNLNDYYLNTCLGSTWSNKIENHTWIVGGIYDTTLFYKPDYIYDKEIVNTYSSEKISTTYYSDSNKSPSKVGLMYMSDYLYAATSTYWKYNGCCGDVSYNIVGKDDWLYLGGVKEYTITRRYDSTTGVYSVADNGSRLVYGYAQTASAIRPTFYLNSNTKFVFSDDGTIIGTGRIDDPYIVSK